MISNVHTIAKTTQPDRHQGGSEMVSARSRGTRGAAREKVPLTSSIDGRSERVPLRGAPTLDDVGGSWLDDMTTYVSTAVASQS